MGCHTWTYRKFNSLTDEEKKNIIDKELNEYKKYHKSILNKKSYIKRMNDLYKRCNINNVYTEKDYIKNLKETQEYIKSLEQYNYSEYLKYKIKNKSIDIIKYKEEYYYQSDFDNPFRLCIFTERIFRNKQKLLSFLKRQELDTFGYYDDKENKFIKGYNDELLKRINDYYNKYGEDNLLFNFG